MSSPTSERPTNETQYKKLTDSSQATDRPNDQPSERTTNGLKIRPIN